MSPFTDLVQRAVAADRDDELGAAAGGLLGELDEMPGPLGEERLAGEAEHAARWASSGQRFPVTPLSDAGLTRKTVLNRDRP